MAIPITPIRRALQFWLRGGAAQKYGVTRLYQELQAAGRVYRYQEFLTDYRSYTQAYERGEKLKFVRLDYKPSKALFTEARVGMRQSFKYNVETKFVDRAGRVYSTRSHFIASDIQLTRGQIEDRARADLGDIAEDYDCPNIATKLTEAWHREGDYWD